MAYYGEELHFCRQVPFNFHQAYIVVVSGDKWNPCGHAILKTGVRNGYYFHVAPPIRSNPKYMDERGYLRYLKEHNKRELMRQWVPLKSPYKAQEKLDELLSKKWTWMVVPNNCASFVEEILKAGGADTGVYSNCPALEQWK